MKLCNSLLLETVHTESFYRPWAQPEKMGMEGCSSLPPQQRKWIYRGIIHSLALCLKAPLMLHFLSEWGQQENWLANLDVMQKVRTNLGEDMDDCRAAFVQAGRKPAPQEAACCPKATCMKVPEQDREGISKWEHRESNPTLTNLNSLSIPYYVFPGDTGNF